MQRLVVSDTEIEYTDQGEGEPILLVHAGVFADWFLPLSVSPELAGFRVIRVRRAGYASEVPEGHLTIGDHARHHALLAEHLDIPALHVVGHSSGCCVSLQLALERPDLVKSLILMEPAAGGGFFVPAAEVLGAYMGPAMAASAAGDLRTAFDIFLRGFAGDNVLPVIQASLGKDGYERAIQESAFFPDEVQAVQEWQFGQADGARLGQPVLNLQGGAQPVHTIELARQITARVEELLPQAETLVVPGVSHAMPLQDPHALGRLIASFVRKQGA